MKNRTINKKNILIVLAVLLAGIITGTAAFGLLYFNQTAESPGQDIELSDSRANLDKRVSFLLIGADKRPGDKSFNADSLIVASVDPETKIISMLSIPRDTRVTVGASQFLKINAVPMLKGIPDLMKQVTELTGIPLDGYVMTNFEGFKSIIDTLGGVTIYVEKEMGPYETGDKVDGFIHLLPGEQRMTGSIALQYARFRNDAMADISRTARQQNVLKAVAKEMLQVSTITKIPKLIPQLTDAVETDLSMVDLLKLSKVAAGFNSSNIISQTLPGAFLDLDGISYWEVNKDQAKTIAKNLMLGITTDKILDHAIIDLLDPDIKAHITVPGGPRDPNGKDSPGHETKFPTDKTDNPAQSLIDDNSDNNDSNNPSATNGDNTDPNNNTNTDKNTNTNTNTNTSPGSQNTGTIADNKTNISEDIDVIITIN